MRVFRKHLIPRVSVEVKIGDPNVHSIIVASQKAEKIKSIYPYLRYLLVVYGVKDGISRKALRHGESIDAIIAIKNKDFEGLLKIVKNQIETSKKIERALFSKEGKAKVFEKEVRIEY